MPPENPQDPLLKTGPDPQRELFRRFGRAADGFPREIVVGAAANLVVNALRQAHPTREAASRAYDEHAARVKAVLMEHYDGAGRKRGIFPYDQVIVMPPVDLRRRAH